MTDPTRHRQLEELGQVNLCTRILYQARDELYLNMRFLDLPLSSLGFKTDWNRSGVAAGGWLICYGPECPAGLFKKGRNQVNRAYLHMLFHYLFCHMYNHKDRDKEYWGLACDIAMESVVDGLYQKCVHVSKNPLHRETYLRLKKAMAQDDDRRNPSGPGEGRTGHTNRPVPLTAERIYQALKKMNPPERHVKLLKFEFFMDNHNLWEQEDDPRQSRPRQNQWDDNREEMQAQMETGSKGELEDNQSLLDQVQVENGERHDYSQFLRKFAVMRGEMQVDPDSFGYAFYTYGLPLYGDMPLIEPPGSEEVYKILDFVIVIGTSMSCSGDLVQRFLEGTHDMLSETESYFRKVHIRLIQCDDKIQSDMVVTEPEELKDYMEHLEIEGLEGTDFRPAFGYVNGLQASRGIGNLRGLVYFTGGKGIYPVQVPPYDTAFVFIENMFSDELVPAWVMRVVLEEEQIMRYRSKPKNTREQDLGDHNL